MKNLNETQKLINNINETTDLKMLEFTITHLIMGWTIDDDNQEDYKDLLRISINRLRTICRMNDIEHPLMNMDVDTEEDRIKTSFRLSMIKSIIDIGVEKQRFDLSLN